MAAHRGADTTGFLTGAEQPRRDGAPADCIPIPILPYGLPTLAPLNTAAQN